MAARSGDGSPGRRTLRWAVVAVLAATLLAGSALPAGGAGLGARGPFGVAADKWIHAGGYAVLAAAVAVAVDRGPDPRTVLAVLLAVAGFGLGVEGLQAAVPWRAGDPADAVANAAGAALALAAWWARSAVTGGPGTDREGDGPG